MIEDEAAAAVRCEDDGLLASQQSRQHRPSAGGERARQVRCQLRQRPSKNIR